MWDRTFRVADLASARPIDRTCRARGVGPIVGQSLGEVHVQLPGLQGAPPRAVAAALYRALLDDGLTDAAAQLGYYLLFSLFPMLLFLAALVAYLPLGHAVDVLLARASALMPAEALGPVRAQLDSLLHRPRPHLLTLGMAVALYSASRAADVCRKALNVSHRVRETRSAWLTQLIAVGFTLLAGVLLLAAAAMITAGGAVGDALAKRLGLDAAFHDVWRWLRWPGSAAVTLVLASLGYRLLPNAPQRFRVVTAGSVVATGLSLGGAWAFTFFVGHFGSYDVTYGSLGGAVVLLSWLYLCGLGFLIGGALDAVIARLAVPRAAAAARPHPPWGSRAGATSS